MVEFVFFASALLGNAAPQFEAPFRVEAETGYINVDDCHAAPVYEDLDGDGLKELIVGQFAGGMIRVYRNHGTNAAPVFRAFDWLQAEGKAISVSFG